MRPLSCLLVLLISTVALANDFERDEVGQEIQKEQKLVDRETADRLARIRRMEAKSALSAAQSEELKSLRAQYDELVSTQKILKSREAEHREWHRKREGKFDHTGGVSPICSVHGERMSATRVQIAYGLMAIDPDAETRKKKFPNAEEFILGGCVVGDDSPRHGTKFVCKTCVAAERQWMKQKPKTR